MGRRCHRLNYDGERLHLRHVPLSQGYDAGGAYWGTGTPLWCAWGGEIEIYTRASNRSAAKAAIDAELDTPAKFFR